MPPFWSFLALTTLMSVVGRPLLDDLFVTASLAFSTSLPSSRLIGELVGTSGDLSIRIYLLRVRFLASVLACVVGSCLRRASVYRVFVPLSFVCFSLRSSGCVVAVCSSPVTLHMSPLTFSRMEEISWEEFSIALLISSLASSHMLYSLSAACLVCLVASLIASAACSVESRRGPICLITTRAISSAFWATASCSRRVATARIPLGSTLGGAQ